MFDAVRLGPRTLDPGQVNNVYIFPGLSYGCQRCGATTIPDSCFLKAAEAVANSLDAEDLEFDRVVPRRDRIRDVSLKVATAVALECQAKGLATRQLGSTAEEVEAALKASQWEPTMLSSRL